MKAVRAAMIALLCLIPLSKGRPLVSAYGSFSSLIRKGLPVVSVLDHQQTIVGGISIDTGGKGNEGRGNLNLPDIIKLLSSLNS
jgi:hypothetical protein